MKAVTYYRVKLTANKNEKIFDTKTALKYSMTIDLRRCDKSYSDYKKEFVKQLEGQRYSFTRKFTYKDLSDVIILESSHTNSYGQIIVPMRSIDGWHGRHWRQNHIIRTSRQKITNPNVDIAVFYTRKRLRDNLNLKVTLGD